MRSVFPRAQIDGHAMTEAMTEAMTDDGEIDEGQKITYRGVSETTMCWG